MTSTYLMDSGSDLGRRQMDHLQELFDPVTVRVLGQVDLPPGARCLDVGAGGGSITRWLADRAGPDGHVVAVDLDTGQLDVPPEVERCRRDIRDGLPGNGMYDVIHARAVLMHLPEREQIFKLLLDSLAPGGWIVLGDAENRPQQVLAAPSDAAADVVDRVIRAGVCGSQAAGVSWDWAREIQRHMADAGLIDLRGAEYAPMISGGDAGALLYENYTQQMEQLVLGQGITPGEIAHFRTIMHDPALRVWGFMRMVVTAGRKPMA